MKVTVFYEEMKQIGFSHLYILEYSENTLYFPLISRFVLLEKNYKVSTRVDKISYY